jgi:putative hydrolase of the HAD superfamily
VSDGVPSIQRAKLAALSLTDAFDVIVLSDEIGRSFRKPHPAPFLAAATKLGAAPAECVMVGDRPDKDVRGARASGFLGAVRVLTGEYAARPDEDGNLVSLPDVVAACDWINAALSAQER